MIIETSTESSTNIYYFMYAILYRCLFVCKEVSPKTSQLYLLKLQLMERNGVKFTRDKNKFAGSWLLYYQSNRILSNLEGSKSNAIILYYRLEID